METEIWKDIWTVKWIDFTWLYQVSNLGNIKSLERKVKWWHNNLRIEKEKILKLWNMKGYLCVQLSNNWIQKTYLVHRLVADAFIFNKDNKKEVNHKNWIKNDNRVGNLEWNTQSENRQHCVNVLWKNWKKVIKLDLNWNFIKKYNSMQRASLDSNLYKSSVCKVCNWKRKTAWWFIFKYE